MGPGHHHHRDFSHWDGFGFWWLWPFAAGLMILVLLWAVRDLGLADGVRGWLADGSRRRWRSAVARHREIAAAFAAYECDPQAVLRRPVLCDVRHPATALFVEAFAEACALATDRYPGRAMADQFMVAADRAARAWAAATEAAERLRTVRFAPGEQALLGNGAGVASWEGPTGSVEVAPWVPCSPS